MATDGSNGRRVTHGPGISVAYSWSPDGRRIAFSLSRRLHPWSTSAAADIYAMDPDGFHIVRLTRGSAISAQPAWSCDGSRLAFVRADGPRVTNLYIMSADGRVVRRLTAGRSENVDPAWRP